MAHSERLIPTRFSRPRPSPSASPLPIDGRALFPKVCESFPQDFDIQIRSRLAAVGPYRGSL